MRKSFHSVPFLLLVSIFAATGHPRGFYFDSNAPDNSGSGRSASSPWRNFSPLGAVHDLGGGDTLFLKRGSFWDSTSFYMVKGGTKGKPEVMTSYGPLSSPRPHLRYTGENPVLRLAGSHMVIQGLHLSGSPQACAATSGTSFTDVTLRDMQLEDCNTGISIERTDTVLIQGNDIRNMHFFKQAAGAVGISISMANQVRILDNRLRWCTGTKGDTTDGGGIELFRRCTRVEIARNRAYRTNGFMEMGGFRSQHDSMKSILVHHNIAMETKSLAWISLATPVDSSDKWGCGFDSVYFINNTLIQDQTKGSLSFGTSVKPVSPDPITFKGNLITGDSIAAYFYNSQFTRSGNIFWSRLPRVAPGWDSLLTSRGERQVDPRLVSKNLDSLTYILSDSSPARSVGAGASAARALGKTLMGFDLGLTTWVGAIQPETASIQPGVGANSVKWSISWTNGGVRLRSEVPLGNVRIRSVDELGKRSFPWRNAPADGGSDVFISCQECRRSLLLVETDRFNGAQRVF